MKTVPFPYLSEQLWHLQLKNKSLQHQLDAFKSGQAYTNQKKRYESMMQEKDVQIKKLTSELSKAHAQAVTNRKNWFEVYEDLEREYKKEIAKKDREIAEWKKRILEVERQRDDALDKLREKQRAYYSIGAELEEERAKNQKLTAQVNKDFQNSSIPSSQQVAGRKKIPNSREKTGRKPGGQKGHEGHRLMRQEATQTQHLPDPEEYKNHPEYYPTKELVRRQKIRLSLDVTIQEYTAAVFRHRKTGSRVHAKFPPGYETDISYDSTVKAFAFLLANEGNMAAGKIQSVLREVSGGKINLSTATIHGLCREFSEKTKPEQQELINDLMCSSVLNVDFTNANVNGSGKQVLILAAPSTESVLYIGRENKGHKGIIGTPLENYVGTLVHDHDTTFYSYGLAHQECMQHNMRYLIGSQQNEPNRTWNTKMHQLFQEMIHYKNTSGVKEVEHDKVAAFEKRYDEILEQAKEEYENEPPNDYYRDGYNLYRRLEKYKEAELLFLHHEYVPANNSLAERRARVYKRKQKQMIVVRSNSNFGYLCDSLSLIYTWRQQEKNLYSRICDIFARPREKKKSYIPGRNNEADVHS